MPEFSSRHVDFIEFKLIYTENCYLSTSITMHNIQSTPHHIQIYWAYQIYIYNKNVIQGYCNRLYRHFQKSCNIGWIFLLQNNGNSLMQNIIRYADKKKAFFTCCFPFDTHKKNVWRDVEWLPFAIVVYYCCNVFVTEIKCKLLI